MNTKNLMWEESEFLIRSSLSSCGDDAAERPGSQNETGVL